MKKVAINKCYGGFGLSLLGKDMLLKLKGYNDVFFYKMGEYRDFTNDTEYLKINDLSKGNDLFTICLMKDYGDKIFESGISEEDYTYGIINNLEANREDEDLIKVIETLGDEANSRFAKLKIIEIPSDVEYEIDEYDGIESIHEIHRVWS